jgi:predicted phosphodiesterase
MERTRPNKKPDLILCSDMHLRYSVPRARTDVDLYWNAQWVKVDFISKLQEKYGCAVVHAGDLFNHWKPSPYELTMSFIRLPQDFWTIYGQHDLPQHNLELGYKSGVEVLASAKRIHYLPMGHWGTEVSKQARGAWTVGGKTVFVMHTLTYKDERPYPDHKGPSAMRLLKKYPDFDLIVTGDNHIPFVQEYEGRLLVNPGSMMRMTAAQIDHRPRVYLWYAQTNSVEPVYLPITKDVVSRDHIDVKEKRERRIDAFISKLDDTWEAETGFEENLEVFFNTNKTDQEIRNIIYKAIENGPN